MAKKSSGALSKDDRFKSASFDPRFNLPSLKKNKVKVDDRFSKAEIRKVYATSTGRKAKVDRYGRKIKDSEDSDFDKYFEEETADPKAQSSHESEDGSAKHREHSELSSDSSDSESDGSEADTASAKKKKLVAPFPLQDASSYFDSNSDSSSASGMIFQSEQFIDRARGDGLQSESSSEDSDSDSESESEEIAIEEEKPEEGDPSATFAVVNLDWENVRAVDLMSTYASFVPKGGSIKSVTIYPSEFGKEQMQKEEVEGPPKQLFRSKKNKRLDSDSDDDSDLDLAIKEDLEKATRKLYEEDNGEEDYDSKALRRYQLQRLRYYYAVVRCDSTETAQNIYRNCDGSEYESTANIFDLRYVPEGMEFEEDEAKEVCTQIPFSYRPDSTFVTDALQHSKVKLTWDETPKERLPLTSRLFSQKEIDEMDFKAYLASDTDESEAESSLLKEKYKNLLGGKFSFDNGRAKDEEVDMEISFKPGLDENKHEEPEEKEETTIQAYKRKEKERREKRMEKFKEKNSREIDEAADVKKKDKKSKKHNKKRGRVDEKSQAELELLMMNEHDKEAQMEHFSMRDVVKGEKRKGKKKSKKNYDDKLSQDDFKPDVNDERFKEAFESHEFAIDPTNSEFKKTNAMKEILKERSKRLHKSDDSGKKNKRAKNSENQGAELHSLVTKLKLKW